MNTIKAGEIFCRIYNRENGTEYSAKEVFRNVITPILFDRDKSRHLVIWQNSKFSHPLKKDPFEKSLDDFCAEVESDYGGLEDSIKTYCGCSLPVEKIVRKNDVTYKMSPSSTLSYYNENIHFTTEERYMSWIGSAFAINAGSVDKSFFMMILNDEKYISIIWKSIKAYAKALDDNPNMKGFSLCAWNTEYLYRYLERPNSLDTMVNDMYSTSGSNPGGIVSHIRFEQILYIILKHFRDVRYIYLFSSGKCNASCGAIMISMPDAILREYDVFEKIYTDMHEDFSSFNFYKDFGGEPLLKRCIETGCVYRDILNPLTDIDMKHLNDKLLKYLEIVMTEEQKKMVVDFVNDFKEISRGTRNSVNLDLKSISAFRDSIVGISKKHDVSDKKGIMDMIEYMFSNDTDKKMILAYINFKI